MGHFLPKRSVRNRPCDRLGANAYAVRSVTISTRPSRRNGSSYPTPPTITSLAPMRSPFSSRPAIDDIDIGCVPTFAILTPILMTHPREPWNRMPTPLTSNKTLLLSRYIGQRIEMPIAMIADPAKEMITVLNIVFYLHLTPSRNRLNLSDPLISPPSSRSC